MTIRAMAQNANDVRRAEVRRWLDAALKQVAAESHLDGIPINSADLVSPRLQLGNTPQGTPEDRQQYLRLTAQQAPTQVSAVDEGRKD